MQNKDDVETKMFFELKLSDEVVRTLTRSEYYRCRSWLRYITWKMNGGSHG